MGAKITISFLCLVLLFTGLALTFNFTKPWYGLSAGDWGWVLISWAGDIAVVYLIIDFLLLREDRLRWREVKDKINEQIERTLIGIAIDIENVSGVSPVVTFLPLNEDKKAEQQAWRNAHIEKMTTFVNDISNIRDEVKRQDMLFKGVYGLLFAHRAESLAALHLRYSKFLDPRLVVLMMDLEDHLRLLDSDLAITRKKGLLSSWYEEDAYRELQALLRIVVQAIQAGQIKLWHELSDQP
ncbi:MAG: hypothetical protein ABSF09_00015 [Candidatus Bathyarchaeia archaeon]